MYIHKRALKQPYVFVVRHDSPGFAERMSDEKTADAIARATGFLGPCCQYLFETSDALKQAGIDDPTLNRLARMVRARQAD